MSSNEWITDESESETYVKQFSALSDVIRLDILHLLSTEGKMCVCDLEEKLILSQSKLSYHLKILLAAHLIHKECSSTWSYYWPDEDSLNKVLSKDMLSFLKTENKI